MRKYIIIGVIILIVGVALYFIFRKKPNDVNIFGSGDSAPDLGLGGGGIEIKGDLVKDGEKFVFNPDNIS